MRYLMLATLAVGCCSSLAADEPISGLPVGEVAKSFEIQIITGDEAGKKVDYLKTVEKKPVLLIFERELTRPGFGLIRMLDKYGRLRQPDGLEVLIVLIADDIDKTTKQARHLHDNLDVKSTSAVSAEGKMGPKNYGLNDEAEMTILLLDQKHKVVLNTARRAPEKQDFDEVRKAIDKMLGPSPVPYP